MTQSKKVMRDSIRMFFPTGRNLSVMLTNVSRGMAASALLGENGANPADLDLDGSIIVLPQFSIREFDGSESVNRIQWSGESGRPVRLVPDTEAVTLRWSVQDSSLPELTGELSVTPFAGSHIITGDIPPMIGLHAELEASPIAPAAIAVSGEHDVARQLGKITAAGRRDLFALTHLLTPFARDAVDSASMRVHREIHGLEERSEAAAHIIDAIERESVLDELMLGVRDNESVVLRMIRRVAATDATVCKSVAIFMATAIRSGAETQVRNHIGDPHVGRVIRRLARELRQLDPNFEVDPAAVLDAYKREHPKESIGMGRILDALTAGATISSQTVHFDIEGDASASAERA